LLAPLAAPIQLLWWAADTSVGTVREMVAQLRRLLVTRARLLLQPRAPPDAQAQRHEQTAKSQ
jgi:hypothetical protein